jgi:hypothetical protein
MAVVTNYCNLGGLNQQKRMLLQLMGQEPSKPGVHWTPLGEDPFCLFQLLVVPGAPWLLATLLQSHPLLSSSHKDTRQWS